MKIKLFFTALVFMLSITTTYASFPVLRTEKPIIDNKISDKNVNANIANKELLNNVDVEEVYTAAAVVKKGRDKWVGVAFWFFLGWPFAAHRWYYGKPVLANILFILTIGGLGIWAIIDLVNILTDNF
ncbi:MAG: TM2 domain-containing protein [Flavobacteriaceae bacterium]|nr:TM2 domain-containing protein [Flavobacteriaceae bacterium]